MVKITIVKPKPKKIVQWQCPVCCRMFYLKKDCNACIRAHLAEPLFQMLMKKRNDSLAKDAKKRMRGR